MENRISEKVTWVGKVDWILKRFHGEEYSTHKGSSYNSYLIRDQKTVLIDTVWKPFDKEFVSNLKRVIDLNQIDYKNDGRLIKIISSLKDMGLDGIEGYYHDYSEHFRKFCFEIADIFDLAISGGSDFHGQNKKNVLGEVSSGNIPYFLLPELKRRAERKEDILTL
jgi:predicted metal-dependent phosphoesterase TrpH